MDNKALWFSVVAMVGGVGLLHVYMRAYEERVGGGALHTVLVMSRDAHVGETLTRSMLAARELPSAYVESRHIESSEIDKIIAGKLEIEVHANEALLWSDVAGMAEHATSLSSLVRQGMRGYALRSGDDTFGSLLEPGDRVDVLAVEAPDHERDSTRASTLLENVLVLAVGDDIGHQDAVATDAHRRSSAGHVTLLVTNDQSRVLAVAERNSVLRILVRNPDDIVLSTPVTNADMKTRSVP